MPNQIPQQKRFPNPQSRKAITNHPDAHTQTYNAYERARDVFPQRQCVRARAPKQSLRCRRRLGRHDFFFTSSTILRGMWKKLSSSFSFTCVCRSEKHSLMFRRTSLFSCDMIEPLIHESFDVPSLL